MSHMITLCPQSTGGLMLADNCFVQVHEEEGEYRPFSSALVEYTDLVDKKLPQIRALGWALESAEYFPEGSIKDMGLLIIDLVDEVMLAQKAMWAEYNRRQAQ
ncbi:hypothetical protein [Thiohalomonas denitrificans]|uniref:hypothetical protein n=1 Tax=Thiohalomonas denitrificans TaxID=415747 RepID=UPI0026ED0D4C|nr:hypothetical protein [Thiohalomonas denitrificans]